jgi:hypothetical protein
MIDMYNEDDMKIIAGRAHKEGEESERARILDLLESYGLQSAIDLIKEKSI